MIVRRPSSFIEPCLPSKVARPPSGPLWVHEIKHDGYRLMLRRDGSRVRCFTRNGHVEADGCALSQRAVEGVAQVEEPGERGGAAGARGTVALALAHPSLHSSAQMENRTKATNATLRTIIAIAATSMMESRPDAMRNF